MVSYGVKIIIIIANKIHVGNKQYNNDELVAMYSCSCFFLIKCYISSNVPDCGNDSRV